MNGDTLGRLFPEPPRHDSADAVVATAWLRDQPGVTAPVVGPRTEEQLDDALASLDVTIEPAVEARLDEIFPGPGPAPEAYAW